MAFKPPALSRDDSGALSNEKAELFALAVAEGTEPSRAWSECWPANENSGASLQLRKHYQGNPLWIERVEQLKAERIALEADKHWGTATWMINECFRVARATRDLAAMRDSAKMRLQVAMKTYVPPQSSPQEAPETPDADETTETAPKEPEKPNNVGAPTVKSPQSSTQQSLMRQKLIESGLKNAPKPVEEDA